MRSRAGIIFTIGLLWLGLTLFLKARDAMRAEFPDGFRVVSLFAGIVIVGLITGIVFVTTCMPSVAEWAGNFFFNPSQRLEDSPQTRALEALGARDFETALAEYQKAWQLNPSDEAVLAEITKIACDKLEQPEDAAAFFEAALDDTDLTVEEACALRLQLAQVDGLHLDNVPRAKELLARVIADLPNTRYSAKANSLMAQLPA
jgi:tetratricopeptide (TPR) repeat protein